jgi:hypothetical protein
MFVRVAVLAALMSAMTGVVPAVAQGFTPYGYERDDKGCLKMARWYSINNDAVEKDRTGECPENTTPKFELASRVQVRTVVQCSIISAIQKSDASLNLSKSTITGSLTYSEVTKDSNGFKIPASIPVFANILVDLSDLKEVTTSTESEFKIEPGAKLPTCESGTESAPFVNALFKEIGPPGIFVKETLTFNLVATSRAGASINLVPVGLILESGTSKAKTHKLVITIAHSK